MLFVPFANSFLNSIAQTEKVRIMVAAFRLLDINTQKRFTYRPYQSFDKRWLLLRCFIFQQWLTRTSNTEIKTQVEVELKGVKSGGVVQPINRTTSKAPSIKPTNYPGATRQDEAAVIPITSNTKQSRNGLQSLLSSQMLDITTTAGVSTVTSTTTTIDPNSIRMDSAGMQSAGTLLTPATTLIDEKKKLLEKAHWSTARMLHPNVMDKLCASYLLIHREDGVDIISKLTPLEVYSADWLCKRKHGRFSGDANFSPSNDVLGHVLTISTKAKSLLDTTSSASYQVARAGSS